MECSEVSRHDVSAKDLVGQLLQPAPKMRITAEEVLEHPWLRVCPLPLHCCFVGSLLLGVDLVVV